MKIKFNPETIEKGHVLALGNFDGFHLGHKKIINKTKEIAAKKDLIPAVLTFEPHPIEIFKPEIIPIRLNGFKAKMELLQKAGVEVCYVIKFNRRFSEMKAAIFIKKYLKGNDVVTGFNFSFGHNREGSSETLKTALGENYMQLEAVKEAGSVYSSSMVRMAIKNGEIDMANKILGHNYFIEGRVLPGAQKGRELGFPTANIKLQKNLLRPKYGVYAVKTNFGNGVANFGLRPTLDGKQELLEIHIFNFDKNIYGQKLKTEFLSFIREEKAYNSLDELKKQIVQDCERAKELC